MASKKFPIASRDFSDEEEAVVRVTDLRGKRLLGSALSVVLGLSLLPTNAIAEELAQSQQGTPVMAAEPDEGKAQTNGVALESVSGDASLGDASGVTSAREMNSDDSLATVRSCEESGSAFAAGEGTASPEPASASNTNGHEAAEGVLSASAGSGDQMETGARMANEGEGESGALEVQDDMTPMAASRQVPESVAQSDAQVGELPMSLLIDGASDTWYDPKVVHRGDEVVLTARIDVNPIKARIEEMGKGREAFWDQTRVDVHRFVLMAALGTDGNFIIPPDPHCTVENFNGLEVKNVQVEGQTIAVTMGLSGDARSYTYRQLYDLFTAAGDERGLVSLSVAGLRVRDDAAPGTVGVTAGAAAAVLAATSDLYDGGYDHTHSYSYEWASNYDLGLVVVDATTAEPKSHRDAPVQTTAYREGPKASGADASLPKTADACDGVAAISAAAAGLVALEVSRRLRRE